jgi:hypothetical protein
LTIIPWSQQAYYYACCPASGGYRQGEFEFSLLYRVMQVKIPITKLYSWAQRGCREEGRVLSYSVFAPKFQRSSCNGLEMAIL